MPTWFVADPTKALVPPVATSGANLVILSPVLDVEALLALVGLAADETWERGSKRAAAAGFAGIKIVSGRPESSPPDDHLGVLLNRLEPAKARIAAATSDDRVSVRLWLVHRLRNWNPGISLSTDLISRIDELGTGIEIDIYVLDGPTTA